MALPTPEYVNTWLGQQFEADCINRKKIKTLNKYNKLSIKTKIKRLKDNLKNDIEFLQHKFIREVTEILDEKGIFILEHADLYCIIKNNIFDTICHEHLGFFSSKVIIDMMNLNGLKVFDHEFNNINGGSTQYFICKKNSKYYKMKIILNVASYSDGKNTLLDIAEKCNLPIWDLYPIVDELKNKKMIKIIKLYNSS